MAGAGQSALEKFQNIVKEELDKLRAAGPVTWCTESDLVNKKECSIAKLQQAAENAKQDVLRPKNRATLASDLLQIGKTLLSHNEFEGAIRVGFEPCKEITNSLEDRLEANLCSAQAWVRYLEQTFAFGRASFKLPLNKTKSVTEVVSAALSVIRKVHEEIRGLHPLALRESKYWVTHNAAQLCLNLCEPMIVLGQAETVRSHLLFSIMAVESQLPLCATKFLHLRVKLYTAAWTCYESLGKLKAALGVAQRFRGQIEQLRLDEMQDPPIPEGVLTSLNKAQRHAEAAIVRLSLLELSRKEPSASEHLEEDAGNLLKTSLGIDLEGKSFSDSCNTEAFTKATAYERLEALSEILSVSGTRQLRAHASAVHDGINLDLSELQRFSQVAKVVYEAAVVCLEHSKLQSSKERFPIHACIHLAESFLKYDCQKGAAIILKALTESSEPLSREADAKIELLRILTLVSMQLHPQDSTLEDEPLNIDSQEENDSVAVGAVHSKSLLSMVGYNAEEDAMLVSGEKAEVEGRLIFVNTIRYLSQSLRHFTGTLRMSDPDLLIDAALMLWSPFCTAMLDTVGSSKPNENLNSALAELTCEVLDCANFVLLACDMEDALLRAIITVRYAGFLHAKDVQESRTALQVLRRGLQALDIQRGELCSNDGLASLTANEKTLRGRRGAGSLASLAAIHCDMLVLLFTIEFDITRSEENAAKLITDIGKSARKAKSDNSKGSSKSNAAASTPTGLSNRLRATEQRLSAEFRHNKYARAILAACTLPLYHRDMYAEKAKVLTAAAKFLNEADVQESKFLEQLQKPSSGENLVASCVPSLCFIARSATSIEIELRTNRTESEVHHFILFGKPAGSGTEVSMTNTSLLNTGVPILPNASDCIDKPLCVHVSGLVPNETYVFAIGAFNKSGELLGGGISPTSMEVQTLTPLPLLACYQVLSLTAFQCIQSIITGPSRDYQSLHKSIKEQVNICKEACRSASTYVVNAFMQAKLVKPIWEQHPGDDYWLIRDELMAAPQSTLQGFVKSTLILHKLENDSRPLWKAPSSNLSMLARFDIQRSAVESSATLCRRTQALSLALHAACGLQDNMLTLEVVSAIYHTLLGLFMLQQPLNSTLRVLIGAQYALRQIPQVMWTDKVCTMYACCTYQILRLTSSAGEEKLAQKVLFPALEDQDLALEIKEGEEPAFDDIPEKAFHADRTVLENQPEQHALATQMRLELGNLTHDPVRILSLIHDTVRNTHQFDQSSLSEDAKENSLSANVLGIDEIVLINLARSRAAQPGTHRAAYITQAWKLLSSDEAENSPDFLKLLVMVCRESLSESSCDTMKWADEAQHELYDLDKDCPAHPQPFVLDVLLEERLENGEPLEAIVATKAPISEDPDPLGFEEIDFLRTQREELLNRVKSLQNPEGGEGVETSEADDEQDDGGLQTNRTGGSTKSNSGVEVDKEANLSEIHQEEIAQISQQISELDVRLDYLERRFRLATYVSERAAKTPDSTEDQRAQEQLIILAELELTRALCLYRKWLAVDWALLHASDTKVKYDDVGEGRLMEGVIDEGPQTDLRWQPMKDGSSGGGEPAVPRLRPLPNSLSEGLGEGNEEEDEDEEEDGESKHGSDKGSSSGLESVRTKEKKACIEAYKAAFGNTPQLIHLLSRSMSRAKFAGSWKQLESIGKLLWNVLEYAWVSPTQFTEDAVCEAALVPALRAKLQLARDEETKRHGDDGEGLEGLSSHGEMGGHHSQSADAPQVESGCYDWRPIFRACVAVITMLEARSSQRHSEAFDANSSPDVWWASRLVGFALQVLCHLKRWAQLAVIGKRYIAAVNKADALVGHIMPLVLIAHKRLTEQAVVDLERVAAALDMHIAAWTESQNKRKRRKSATRRARATDSTVSEAEQAFLDEKAALEIIKTQCEGRLNTLQAMEQEVVQMQANLTRDKSTCEEALEAAQAISKHALIQYLSPNFQGLELLAPVPGLATRRTRTQRTNRSPRSVASKSTKLTRKTRNPETASVFTKFTAEHEPDPHAELGIGGNSIKGAVKAYVKAVEMMRQKQESALLAQALLELGNLQAAQGGKSGWNDAKASWSDAVDAVLHEVDSIKDWRSILEGIVKEFPSTETKWSCYDNFYTSAELLPSQSILAKFGVRGCVIAALCSTKLAMYLGTGDLSWAQERVRLAGWLFASLFGGSITHPTRTCDFAVLQVEELMPNLDNVLLNFQALRKPDIMQALQFVSQELAQSTRQADQLLSLPIICLYEYAARKWCFSAHAIIDSFLIRATALTSLGLISEAGFALREVLFGGHFLPELEDLVLASVEISRTSLEGSGGNEVFDPNELYHTFHERLALQKSVFTLSNTDAPWAAINRTGLKTLVKDDGFAAEPLPWIAHMMGSDLMLDFKLCKVKLLCQALRFWSPSESVEFSNNETEEAGPNREELLLLALRLVCPNITGDNNNEVATETTDGPGDPLLAQVQNFQLCEQLCVSEILLLNGSLQQCISFISASYKTLRSQTELSWLCSEESRIGSNREIRHWLLLRYNLLRAAELLGSSESTIEVCDVLAHDCHSNNEDDLFREVHYRKAEALARIGSPRQAYEASMEAVRMSAHARDLTFMKSELLAEQTLEAWRRFEHQSPGNATTDIPSKDPTALHLAFQAAEDALTAIGYFEPQELIPRTRRTLYSQLIVAYSVLGCSYGEECDSTEAFRKALEVASTSLIPIKWMQARALLGSKVPNLHQLLECAKMSCDAQGTSLEVGRKACAKIGAMTASKDWLRAAVRFGTALQALDSKLMEFASSVNLEAEADRRKSEMSLYFHDQLASDLGVRGLLSRLQREIFARTIGFDLDRYERVRALYQYFESLLADFKSKFVMPVNEVPGSVPVFDETSDFENNGSDETVSDEQVSESSSEFIALQWLKHIKKPDSLELLLLRPGSKKTIRKNIMLADIVRLRDDLARLESAAKQDMHLDANNEEREYSSRNETLQQALDALGANFSVENIDDSLLKGIRQLFEIRIGVFQENPAENLCSLLKTI